MTDSSMFVHVETYSDYIEANIIVGRLENEGINCWLRDENTVTVNPIWTNAIGGIKLMVAQSQVERAVGLLRTYRNENKAAVQCPKCGSHNIEMVTTPRKASNWFWTLFGGLMASFSLAGDKVYHCFDCSHEFEQNDKEEKQAPADRLDYSS